LAKRESASVIVQSEVIAQRAACIFVAEEASFGQDGYDVVDQVL